MKRSELERKLKAIACVFLEHGRSHDVFVTRRGFRIRVPRHGIINEGLAKSIIRQAQKHS
ncbi:type II toxin-antitoxin system HicA family toxin [Candidatus Nitrospira bockiana]